ncbi:MAG: DUF1552 domain-containing protein [Saccharospirillaceae bacterium]|nr:DUF1552 domain-containing protein [Pseudomonadales bacterium]NRB80160.1 DUF1552 domain-containing protein [Saccharospirillaceae bacterium]
MNSHLKSNKFALKRRSFLKALPAVAAPLSIAGLSKLAMAQGINQLKVVFVVIPDGFAVDTYAGYTDGLWFPKNHSNNTDSNNFTLNELSNTLSDYKNQSTYLKGLILGSGTGGHNGWQSILRDSQGSQTSIDLILGEQLRGSNSTLKRINSGPHATVGASWNVSYDNRSMIIPQTDPYQLYQSTLAGVQSQDSNISPKNNNLFDSILPQLNALKTQLSGKELNKLEAHMQAVEQVNKDLKNSTALTGACNPLSAKPTIGMNISSPDFREQVTKSHIDVIAANLSCGTTKVATLQIGRSADQVIIKSVSTTKNPHDCAHRYGSVDDWKGSRKWYVEQCKILLDQLSSMPDPDVPGDNLLAHTLVVLTSEMADGAPEHMQDVPVTLIGGASGLINHGSNGRFYDLTPLGERSHWKMGTAVDMQRVWATIARAAGTDVPYSGDTSSIPNLFTNV